MLKKLLSILFLFFVTTVWSQKVDFISPKTYKIGAPPLVEGNDRYDANAIRLISELYADDEIQIPGEAVSNAIRKLWDQQLFDHVEIRLDKVTGNYCFLTIVVRERAKLLAMPSYNGVKKSQKESLNERLSDWYVNVTITPSMIKEAQNRIKGYYIDKGFLFTKVKPSIDSSLYKELGGVRVTFDIEKGSRVKINSIIINGNTSISDAKIYRNMKDTKRRMWYRLWKQSKFMHSTYKDDKANIIAMYNEIGLRDARIIKDTMYKVDPKSVNIEMTIDEGEPYYFGNFDFVGNAKYSSGLLDSIVGIEKGELYNEQLLNSRLHGSPDGSDITSIYMNRGHLFFQLTPIETITDSNYINYEVRIQEGKIARNGVVTVVGNTKTNDKVIMREIRTVPGDVFSREDIFRTQRELNQLGFFDQGGFNVQPKPNPQTGEVAIEYTVAEKPSDQIELSGGWGGGTVVGTLGLVFNNFSIQNFFKKEAWRPLPTGDGQKLSIRAQSNGLWYQSYNLSFTEPWLGGKKPVSFTFSAYHSILSNGRRKNEDGREDLKVSGIATGIGWRNKIPDDYFRTYVETGLTRYHINNYNQLFAIDSGVSRAIYVKLNLSRSSSNHPIYPTQGAELKASVKFTPYAPSLWDGVDDYSDLSTADKFEWIQYHKWKFTASWFTSLSKPEAKHKFVLNTRVGFGFLMPFDKNLGSPPYERFYMGGSGLTGFNNLDGREIIAMRGYEDQSVSDGQGDIIAAKYTVELRYPISTNPSATVFPLLFMEAGNTWGSMREFNPFDMKKSVGAGVRLFLPMFGMLGFDYGIGFDQLNPANPGAGIVNSSILNNGYFGKFHFTIGMNLGEL